MSSGNEGNPTQPKKPTAETSIYTVCGKIVVLNVSVWTFTILIGSFVATKPLFDGSGIAIVVTFVVGLIILIDWVNIPIKFAAATAAGAASTFVMHTLYVKILHFPSWMYIASPDAYPRITFIAVSLYLIALIVSCFTLYFLTKFNESRKEL